MWDAHTFTAEPVNCCCVPAARSPRVMLKPRLDPLSAAAGSGEGAEPTAAVYSFISRSCQPALCINNVLEPKEEQLKHPPACLLGR